jgi:hypothetical protein
VPKPDLGYDTLDSRRWGIEMNNARALFVRYLRCELGCSWRTVARECAAQWAGDWGDNQLAGIAFCRSAANHLNEPPHLHPWN